MECKPINYKYHSTGQYRNVIKNISDSTRFKGFDDGGTPIIDSTVELPKLTYLGTVKLHGTNASIILHDSGVVSFHSKSNLLGYVENHLFTLLSDNAEFAQCMWARFDAVCELLEQAKNIARNYNGVEIYPLKVSGEWCGSSIQKGVGISLLPKKSLFVFGIKAGETIQELHQGWLPVDSLLHLKADNEKGLYSIMEFPHKEVEVDFNNPLLTQNVLIAATKECEDCCPVSYQLGLRDSEGGTKLIGEGYVWTPVSSDFCWDSGNWFKTKGEKHSVSKVKTLAEVNPEKLNSMQEFVDYAVTQNRLEQGVTEVGLDIKLVGKFLGWLNRDILKEEADVLEKSGLTMNDVGKLISNKAKAYYFSKLQ